MNSEQLQSLLRSMGLLATAYLVAKGYGQTEANALVGDAITFILAAVSFGTLAWGIWSHRDAAKIAGAASVKGIELITVDPSSTNRAAIAAMNNTALPNVKAADPTPVANSVIP